MRYLVRVQALQFTDIASYDNMVRIWPELAAKTTLERKERSIPFLFIMSPNASRVMPNDWIVRGFEDLPRFYVFSDDKFRALFMPEPEQK